MSDIELKGHGKLSQGLKQSAPIKKGTEHYPRAEGPEPFVILGNGFSGSSLLQAVLNAHPEIDCLFEAYCKGPAANIEKLYMDAHAQSGAGRVFGTKETLEELINHGWFSEHLENLSDDFRVIWLIRRLNAYKDSFIRRGGRGKEGQTVEETALEWWSLSRDIYWRIRERHPDRVLLVTFEELATAPDREVRRCCDFLGVEYVPLMLGGCKDVAVGNYRKDFIDPDKAFAGRSEA